jgi:serine O-acetyltransferase
VVVGAGAKVLGGFTVGAGARIGSNSVVVKEVPPGATAVGIPARIVVPDAPQKPEAEARGRRFVAYGLVAGADDPLAQALHQLIDHIAEQDRRIEQLCAELQRCGMRAPESGQKIDTEKLSRLVD